MRVCVAKTLIVGGVLLLLVGACSSDPDGDGADAGGVDVAGDSGGSDSGGVESTVTVLDGAAPVVTTVTWGHVADLTQDPCLAFTLEATDADSESLTFDVEGLPDGAQVDSDGSTATLSWCPTSAQIDETVSWPVTFVVSDGQYAVRRPHMIWLMPPHGFPCLSDDGGFEFGEVDGRPFSLAWGWRVQYRTNQLFGAAYPEDGLVALIAPDDIQDPPDFSRWTMLPSTFGAGFSNATPTGGRFTIQPDMMDGPLDSVTVAAITEVNADPSGSTCDQTVWAISTELTDNPTYDMPYPIVSCQGPCASSDECESGFCLQTETGSLCDASHQFPDYCPERGVMVTVEGTPVETCLPWADVCVGARTRDLPPGCNADEYEPNDTIGDAAPLTPGVDTEVAELCIGEPDIYAVDMGAGQRLTVGVMREINNWEEHGRDTVLRVLRADGSVLASSNTGFGYHRFPARFDSTNFLHIVEVGSQLDQTVYVEFAGRGATDRELYRLRTLLVDEPCDYDEYEPNGDASMPAVVGSGEDVSGTLCRSDEDWYAVDLAAPGVLDVVIAFQFATVDLDAEVYDPNGVRVGTLFSKGIDEQLRVNAAEAGRYLIRIRGWQFPGCPEDQCDLAPGREPHGRYTARFTY